MLRRNAAEVRTITHRWPPSLGGAILSEVSLTDDALTLAVLRQIRDELQATREELGGGLRDLSVRIDETKRELGARIDETNARLGYVETALGDLAEQQTFVVRWLRAGSRRDRRIETDLVK